MRRPSCSSVADHGSVVVGRRQARARGTIEGMVAAKNAVVVLLDSAKRDWLGPYGGTTGTPHIDRLAARSVCFDRHHAGSLPCIPARHDLLCGALDFLWRPWGSIEVWEQPLTRSVRERGVVTQLITDHPHLFEHGGENYHTDFYAWEYLRGHESDPWQTIVDETLSGTPTHHRPRDNPYHRNRRMFREEADFPGPKTMAAAARWLDDNAEKHDRFLLFVDEFDPHEPFDVPEPYRSMYDDSHGGSPPIWPPYLNAAIPESDARQLRAQYRGKLTMIDAWLGRVLDAMDRNALWESTLFVLVSDHGLYLGEHDNWGKPPSPVYGTLGNVPLLVAAPDVQPARSSALTTNVDVYATLMELFGAKPPPQRTHGNSLLPLLAGDVQSVRDHVLCGYWSQRVHVITDELRYARGVREPGELCIYSNRWSTMPPLPLPPPDERATLGAYIPGSDVPVIRQPLSRAQRLSTLWTMGDHEGDVLLDARDDARDLSGDAARVGEAEQALRAALAEVEAPAELLARFGSG